MANENKNIITAEQEIKLRKPFEDYVGKIQKKIDGLRVEGTDKVISLQNDIDAIKRDRVLTKGEKETAISEKRVQLEKAKGIEEKNKGEIEKLISDAESYLNQHFDKEYYQPIKASCKREKEAAKERYNKKIAQLKQEHTTTSASLSDSQEIKDEKYVYKNKLFDAKMKRDKDFQDIKDRKHRKTFLLQNGLYIAIILIFVMLCIITPIVKKQPLLTYSNVLNVFQQASPRMFLALGVAGLILLTGTDLSIGRMVGTCACYVWYYVYIFYNDCRIFYCKV